MKPRGVPRASDPLAPQLRGPGFTAAVVPPAWRHRWWVLNAAVVETWRPRYLVVREPKYWLRAQREGGGTREDSRAMRLEGPYP